MNELKVKGTQEFLGKEIQVIEGGFGEGQKVVLAKTISEIHGITEGNLNKLINNNISRFNINDLIDIKCNEKSVILLKNSEIFSQNKINASKNIYVLSERGYTKLVSMMDNSNEKKWEIMDKLIEQYFAMREVINSNEQLKANLLLNIYNGGQEGILASKQLTEIEVKEATKPLLIEIDDKEKIIKTVIKDDDLFAISTIGKILKPYSNELGARKIFDYMKKEKILIDKKGYQNNNLPYDVYNKYFETKRVEIERGYYVSSEFKTYFNGKGLRWFLNKLVKDKIITNDQKNVINSKLK